jgi:hypothetical protein
LKAKIDLSGFTYEKIAPKLRCMEKILKKFGANKEIIMRK